MVYCVRGRTLYTGILYTPTASTATAGKHTFSVPQGKILAVIAAAERTQANQPFNNCIYMRGGGGKLLGIRKGNLFLQF